ncbi:MAG: Choline binding protein Cbp10, partial [Streptococcus sp. DORA_10]
MKNRKMLASSLLAGALLSVGYVASKPTAVHALTDMSVKDTQNPLKITLIQTDGSYTVDTLLVDLQRSSTTTDNTALDFDLVNEDTGALASSSFFGRFRGSNRIKEGINILLVKDGNYHLDIYSSGDFGKRYFGRSEVFRISRGEYSPIKNVEISTATETPKQTTNSSSAQTGWSGSSYYKAGVKVVNQWIFDVQYNSYFYLNASGNFVQNAWSGNYYLKSGGYMAKS